MSEESLKLSPTLLWFALQMQRRLDENSDKGDWTDVAWLTALQGISDNAARVRGHKQGFNALLNPLADIANFSAMLACHMPEFENFKATYAEQSQPTPIRQAADALADTVEWIHQLEEELADTADDSPMERHPGVASLGYAREQLRERVAAYRQATKSPDAECPHCDGQGWFWAEHLDDRPRFQQACDCQRPTHKAKSPEQGEG